MDVVEEVLEMQTDEVETDDVLANLFNFMPDLVIISTPHLMRDPPLALQRRLKVCVLVHLTLLMLLRFNSPSMLKLTGEDGQHCCGSCARGGLRTGARVKACLRT
jgi:hypothetical protein